MDYKEATAPYILINMFVCACLVLSLYAATRSLALVTAPARSRRKVQR